MATAENSSDNPLFPLPELQPASSLPQYSELIIEAIEALNEEGGSSKSSISRHIEAAHGNLPASHSTLLAHHLDRMKQSGELSLLKNNYMKPDPNAPPRRGRGRPAKPKADPEPGAVASSPRPRGRPPKARDPFAAPPQPKPKPASVVSPGGGKPRGRPPKKLKTESAPAVAASAVVVDGAAPRGRGRPPKSATPVAC